MIKFLTKKAFLLGEKLRDCGPVKWFAARYPRVFTFFINRISIESFTGLPLSMLACALLANLLLIMDFTPDVINSKEFVVIDAQVAQWLYEQRTPLMAQWLTWLTRLCDTEFVIALSSAVAVLLLLKKKFQSLKALLAALAGSGLTIYLGKNIFQIDRPLQLAYNQQYSFSFPSGHTTISVALYGLLFYFLARYTTYYKLRSSIFALAVLFALLIGFSRLYLCVHYLSDVLGGYLLGSVWLLLSISLYEWMRYTENKLSIEKKAAYFSTNY